VREEIRIERQIRLEKFLDKFEASTPPPHLAMRWSKSLIELYLGYLRAEDPEWPNSKITLDDVLLRSQGVWLHMYVHTPVSNRADSIIEKLLTKDWEGAIAEAKRLRSAEEGQKIASEIQSHNASHRHKKRGFEKLQEDIAKANPHIGHKDFERELRKHIGKGVIHSMDDALNEIRLINDERIFTISGLKHRLTKLKKTI
jgi:hypothetical protein